MTTKPRATRAFPPLPDPPEREPEDMTSFDHLTKEPPVCRTPIHVSELIFTRQNQDTRSVGAWRLPLTRS